MLIKEMSKEERPRERLEKNGVSALSNAELLAIILQNGTKGENIIDVCNRLIAKFGIDKLDACSLTELMSIRGIGKAKAMQIKSIFELNRRCGVAKSLGKIIACPKDVFEYASPKLSGKDREYFMTILLDTKNRLIKDEVISIGTLNSSLIHPREVFKPAIKESADSIILVHNHPSGDPEPSLNDIEITKKLVDSAKSIGIKIFDHIVIGDKKYTSILEYLD